MSLCSLGSRPRRHQYVLVVLHWLLHAIFITLLLCKALMDLRAVDVAEGVHTGRIRGRSLKHDRAPRARQL